MPGPASPASYGWRVGSGLLYGGIGVLWIVVLSRSWLNRRGLARADREAPASSRQRVLAPRAAAPGGRVRHGVSGGHGRGRGEDRGHRVDGRHGGHDHAVTRGPGGVTTAAGTGWPASTASTGSVSSTGASGSPSAPAVLAVPGAGTAGGRTVVTVPPPRSAVRRPSRGTRRRRRVLAFLLVLAAATAVAAGGHRLPWWCAVAAAVAATAWFVLVTFAARAGRRARRGYRRRSRAGELARGAAVGASAVRTARVRPGAGAVAPSAVDPAASAGTEEPSWASVGEVGVVASWGRAEQVTDGIDRARLAEALVGGPAAVAAGLDPAAVIPAAADPASWQPTPVPLPTYVTAPRAPRTVATIDFGVAGSWTSASQPGGEETGRIALGLPGRGAGAAPAGAAALGAGAPDRAAAEQGEQDELTVEVAV